MKCLFMKEYLFKKRKKKKENLMNSLEEALSPMGYHLDKKEN